MEPGDRRIVVGVPADAGGTDMETSIPTTTLAVREVLFSPEEELALAGFLAGYSGLTREAYALDIPSARFATRQKVRRPAGSTTRCASSR
jgi:hypothetical protein